MNIAEATGDMQERLLVLYAEMLKIRLAEEQLATLFADGAVPGFIHLSIGQEAVAVGVVCCLDSSDTVASNHRGHGHALAKGLELPDFYSELFGNEEGLCKGRGGSMHVADLSKGMLGANGIVGAGMSIAVGSALAHKCLGREQISVVFFGDGALGEGLLHESINMAKVLKLPVLFVCENNGWSEFSRTGEQISFELADLARGYGVSYGGTVGNDVLLVESEAKKLIADIRETSKPAVLECKTLRVRGHYEGDAQRYRTVDDDEIDENDPIQVAEHHLIAGGATREQLADIREQTRSLVSDAAKIARDGTQPDFDKTIADVYASGEGT